MNGKEFLDEKFGEKRNGKGIASLLDEFAELKIEEYKQKSKSRSKVKVDKEKVIRISTRTWPTTLVSKLL